MDHIVGMMFCKNEADIISTTLLDAFRHVDSMFISDDGSTDGSWEIINYFKQAYPDKIEHIQQNPDPNDQAQRTSLFKLIQERYKAENTWVQVVEADMILYTHDLKSQIETAKRSDVLVEWDIMNAVRPYWEHVHHFFPHWPEDIRDIMPRFHRLESLVYTYRPLPGLYFTKDWRPTPRGFGVYLDKDTEYVRKRPREKTVKEVPLLCHYGYRGPTHAMSKWQRRSNREAPIVSRHGEDHTSIVSILKTNKYYNGTYNRNVSVSDTPEEAWINRGLTE